MPFDFQPTELPGVLYIAPQVFTDDRGSFAELFKQSVFRQVGIDLDVVQVNHSRSKQNVVRALHYQKEPHAMGKLAVCSAGEVFDVAVDIRKGSPTFGKWIGKTLTAAARNALYIPPGFAHGFCALRGEADLMYFIFGSEYAPDYEAGILWNDPAIGIAWPVSEPLLMERDAHYPVLKEADNSFTYHG